MESSPFGAPAQRVMSVPVALLCDMYRRKCGVDVRPSFGDLDEVALFECDATGMRFWRPASVAGDEAFYRRLSAAWPNYYQTHRWEYPQARAALGADKRVVEVGCGRGYFLRSLEEAGHTAVGLELNGEAIARKVTRFEVRQQMIDALAADEPASFDAACSFQVLEHVVDPAALMRACVRAVRPGGLLLLSTPNYDYPIHRERRDPFDMPPHHLNHFTPTVFERIAARLGLELVGVTVQPLKESLPRRLLRRVWGGSPAHGSQPGHTLLATLRTPPA